MNANDLIESYAGDVARRLPRKQRDGVGFELRALLTEELEARARDADRPADAAMAMALLIGFGPPEEVAERYRPAGFDIIPPIQSRGFIAVALGGVALQWLITLPRVFTAPEAFPGQALTRLGGWWMSYGLGALWWPGLLVLGYIAAALVRQTWPREPAAWTPRVIDRDHINRPLALFGLAAAIAGAALMIGLPSILGHLTGPVGRNVREALAYDDDFWRTRAVFVLPLWAASFALYAWAIAEGRWRVLTRRIGVGVNLAFGAFLAWWLAAGPIWRAAPADHTAKGLIVLIIVFILIEGGLKVSREAASLRRPAGLPSARGV